MSRPAGDAAEGAARKRREREFHDHRFAHGDRSTTRRFYAVDRGRERYRQTVRALASPGARVLEYGCGTGSLAIPLAKGGADVAGIDISHVAIERAASEARRRRVDARFAEMDAEALAFADRSFDLVCGSSILHHLDVDVALGEITRVLAPGGRAVFLEPLGHNPLINAYRRFTPRLRTDDEHPLRTADLLLAERYFAQVDTEPFDLFALAGVPLRSRPRMEAVVDRLHRVDAAVFARSAVARRWAWMVLITLAGPRESRSTPRSTP